MKQIKELRKQIAFQQKKVAKEKSKLKRDAARGRLMATCECLNELLYPKPKELL